MISNITSARAGEAEGLLFDSWFDPIEVGLRAKVRGFIETMIRGGAHHGSIAPALRPPARWQGSCGGGCGVPAWAPHAGADRRVLVARHCGGARPPRGG